jgi:hypothetical protein
MSGKRDSARNALRRAVPFLAEQHHDDILNELDRESLLDTPNGGKVHAVAGDADRPRRPLLTPLQASQTRNGANKDLLRSVQARAARMGFPINIDDKYVDVVALDAAMRGKDVTERLSIKATLAKMALIP